LRGFWKKKTHEFWRGKERTKRRKKKEGKKKTGSTHGDLRKKERGGRERENMLKIEKKEKKSRED